MLLGRLTSDVKDRRMLLIQLGTTLTVLDACKSTTVSCFMSLTILSY